MWKTYETIYTNNPEPEKIHRNCFHRFTDYIDDKWKTLTSPEYRFYKNKKQNQKTSPYEML